MYAHTVMHGTMVPFGTTGTYTQTIIAFAILQYGVVCPGTQRYVDLDSQATQPRLERSSRRRSTSTSPTFSRSSGDRRRHQQAGLFLDPPGVPAGVRPAADSRTQGHFRGTSRSGRDAVPGSYLSLHAHRHSWWPFPRSTSPLRQWCGGGSESVGVCCPAFAPSLNWLPRIPPKHTWFSVQMCALFQSESCDTIQE